MLPLERPQNNLVTLDCITRTREAGLLVNSLGLESDKSFPSSQLVGFTWSFMMVPLSMRRLMVFLILQISFAETGQEQVDATCEEADDLRLSLIQSSLQVAKKPVEAERNATSGTSKDETSMFFNRYVDAAKHAKMMAQKQLNFVMQLVLPTEKTALSGIPALLVFMLAGLVMTLFVVQLISVMFEEKAPPFRPGQPYAPSTTQGTLPAMTLPGSPPSRASMSRPGTVGTVGAASAPSTMSTIPVGRPGARGSGRPSAPDGAAMCPALISPHAEAQFSVPSEGMNSLAANGGGTVGPVAVLGGQTGKALLYARFKADSKQRCWLELSTTANSRFPHCSAGPIDVSGAAVEIRGPRGDRYGTLQKEKSSTWNLYRSERHLVNSISTSPGRLMAMDGQQLIASGRVDASGALEVQVSPGRDPLLTLLCMMAILLTSPRELGRG